MDDKITVIVPVYNVENYLRKCLDSIISQTYKNIEIVVVNDGSTDASGEICKEFSEMDHRILYDRTRKCWSFCRTKHRSE
ncbi:putative glycosyltransferase YibD [Streptococcus pneumoniae]|nr:putative glycosyltransferase YibD [Streptococcus pneumoniae]VOA13796.1 putative glycosyltransferase YibD [Streptococcus pneumoniae]